MMSSPPATQKLEKYLAWRDAMNIEFDALHLNRTCIVIPTISAMNILGYQ
jgi:hypothetical protein